MKSNVCFLCSSFVSHFVGTHIHSNTNSKRNIDDTIANVVFDTKYQYYIYNRNQNATGNFTSYTKIPVNSNFNNGIIDISYNRIQGMQSFFLG